MSDRMLHIIDENHDMHRHIEDAHAESFFTEDCPLCGFELHKGYCAMCGRMTTYSHNCD